MINTPVFLGIDVGTQGVRVAAITDKGDILSSNSIRFPLTNSSLQEQSPREWLSILLESLRKVTAELKQTGALETVLALSVTSTSGTVIALDKNYEPIDNALMYSDNRSSKEAEICSNISRSHSFDERIEYNTSYGLPKILWYIKNHPEKREQIHLWCHAADYILGKLSGIWGITDYTNSLKTGYNLLTEKWPSYIFNELELPASWFPKVVYPGTVLGQLTEDVAKDIGLPRKVKVVSGITDGCASQLASGSLSPGDWSTTIGTTMVIKGVTYNRILDPLGRLYNHKHPQGYWMPGGASNTGGDWVSRDYENDELERLNAEAARIIPSPWISYPLYRKGERFPFISPNALGFSPDGLSKEELFTSRMEGVAYLERLSYEMIQELSNEDIQKVYTAGGASNSNVWLQIRSNVLQKTIYKMKHVEGAVGAAIVAASETFYKNVHEAGSQMTKIDKIIEPGKLTNQYDENYLKFVELMRNKNYI